MISMLNNFSSAYDLNKFFNIVGEMIDVNFHFTTKVREKH